MSRRPFGLHYANDSPVSGDDLAATRQIRPSTVLLCQPHFGAVGAIRAAVVEDVTIVGRFYGGPGIDAWHPPYGDAGRMRAYGVYCAQQAIQYGINVVQFANEPSIESPVPPTPEGFALLRDGAAAWLEGFRSAWQGKVMAGTIPLAPGNREDDYGDWGYRGADILRDVWQRFDVLLLHNYWTCDPGSIQSEWWGYRWTRQLAAYQWQKPWSITEFNRDPACSGRPVGDEARLWFSGIRDSYFVGADWFIWRSNDPQFAGLQMQPRQDLIDAAVEVNTAKEEPMPLTETVITLVGPRELVGGRYNAVTLDISGADQGAMTLVADVEKKPDGQTKYIDDPTVFAGMVVTKPPAQLVVDGQNEVWIYVQPFDAPAPVKAVLRASVIELDGTAFSGGNEMTENITIKPGPLVQGPEDAPWVTGNAPAPDQPEEPMPQPTPPSNEYPAEYDLVYRLAGEVHNKGEQRKDNGTDQDMVIGLRIQKLVQWRKGEIDDPFPAARR